MSEAPHGDATGKQQDPDDLDPDERTADPDMGEQNPGEVPRGPQDPVDPERSDPAT